MKKIWVYILVVVFPFLAFAESPKKFEMDLTPEGLYVANAPMVVVEKIFEDYGYGDFIYMPNWEYPPIFFKEMPSDFNDVEDQNRRNKLFLQILVPLTLRLKEELLIERLDLLNVMEYRKDHEEYTNEHMVLLDTLAEKYDVFTKFTDTRRYDVLLRELKFRVDVVPPSMLLAAAAAESNWGTAREVALGNSLYKMKVWYTDEGIKPLEEDDDSYRIKIYDSLYESIKDYAHKLNTDVNFENFRYHRYQLRRRHKDVRGRTIIYNMVAGSPLVNYAGLLSYILTFYDLINIDESTLASIKMFGKEK